MELPTIGRYQIIKQVGKGGMATVYHAHDPNFERDVAIKILPREFLHDDTFRARFDREARLVAALEHPAIVTVYDYGEENGQPYLVMHYMRGGSLTDRLLEGPLPLAEVARIIGHLTPALDKAHTSGLVHRDLKPDNILFDGDNNPHIADFGIARVAYEASTLTNSNSLIGTPAYMSPEQVRGDAVFDGRSDIYALGIIVFQMLTGRLPFHSDLPVGYFSAHLNEPVPDILDVKPDLPPELTPVIDHALAKEADDRFDTAEQFNVALQRALDPSMRNSTKPSYFKPRTLRARKKSNPIPWLAVVGVLGLLLVIGGVLLLTRASSRLELLFAPATPIPTPTPVTGVDLDNPRDLDVDFAFLQPAAAPPGYTFSRAYVLPPERYGDLQWYYTPAAVNAANLEYDSNDDPDVWLTIIQSPSPYATMPDWQEGVDYFDLSGDYQTILGVDVLVEDLSDELGPFFNTAFILNDLHIVVDGQIQEAVLVITEAIIANADSPVIPNRLNE